MSLFFSICSKNPEISENVHLYNKICTTILFNHLWYYLPTSCIHAMDCELFHDNKTKSTLLAYLLSSSSSVFVQTFKARKQPTFVQNERNVKCIYQIHSYVVCVKSACTKHGTIDISHQQEHIVCKQTDNEVHNKQSDEQTDRQTSGQTDGPDRHADAQMNSTHWSTFPILTMIRSDIETKRKNQTISVCLALGFFLPYGGNKTTKKHKTDMQFKFIVFIVNILLNLFA